MDKIKIGGRSTLRAWKKDRLLAYLHLGMTLAEAERLAMADGALLYENTVHNLVTLSGKYLYGDVLVGVTTNFLSYCAIGTGGDIATPSESDTVLNIESARVATTTLVRTGSILTASAYFLAAQCAYSITEAGWFGAAATSAAGSGTMFCHYLQYFNNAAGLRDLTFDYNMELK